MTTQREDNNDKVIDFAKKFAGHRVHILDRENRNIEAIARVIGYYTDHGNTLLVDFPDDKKRQADCWPIKDNPSDAYLTIDEDVKQAWSIQLFLVRTITIHKPYPHVCKSCKAPCRRNKDASICSNTACKTRRKYVGGLNKQAATMCSAKSDKPPNTLSCGTCGSTILTIKSADSMGRSYHTYHILCINDHKSVIQPRKNDVIDAGNKFYIYNGTMFVAKAKDKE